MDSFNIKILKIEKNNNYCYECDSKPEILAVSKWDTVSFADYRKIEDAIFQANLNPSGKWRYFTVQEVKDTAEIFDSAKEFVAYQEKKEKQRKQEEAKRKKERAAKAKERKLKQLERLKKELANESISSM